MHSRSSKQAAVPSRHPLCAASRFPAAVPNPHTTICVWTAGGQAARAEQLFDRLCSVCKPDAATFNCLVCVYCRLGKVREAANMLEIMLRSGQHVDGTTFNAAIDTCWATGIVPLQQFAQHLYERANQQGLYQTHIVKQVRPLAREQELCSCYHFYDLMMCWQRLLTHHRNTHCCSVHVVVVCSFVAAATCWTCSCLAAPHTWFCWVCWCCWPTCATAAAHSSHQQTVGRPRSC